MYEKTIKQNYINIFLANLSVNEEKAGLKTGLIRGGDVEGVPVMFLYKGF
ncbi:hypothetical protein JXL21_14620 [Candidatus Bathyarchaeota archaeon]|nr:hypothetical protein [Candidatus Bathyarchaeota archaeon]